MTFGNRVTTIPAIPPFSLEQGPSSWRFPFMRPFLARALGAFLRGYQPAGIQRRARAVRDRLTRPEFVEAVGVWVLANALCRLCPAVLET